MNRLNKHFAFLMHVFYPLYCFQTGVNALKTGIFSVVTKMGRLLLALFLALFLAKQACAANAPVVLNVDRDLWPESLDSVAAFDRASRAEILVFSAMLAEVSALDEKSLQQQLAVTSLNYAEIKKVQQRFKQLLLSNMQVASQHCNKHELFCISVHHENELEKAGRDLAAVLPPAYKNWYLQSLLFHKQYVIEMLRLAAIFPGVSSEIDRFSTLEMDGFEMQDRHFLLTFDDGPTDRNGNTDRLLSLLGKQGVNAVFYLVGELLQARLVQHGSPELQAFYRNQCVGIHGWQHHSHAQWDQWHLSILDTRTLLQQEFPRQYLPLFRPPYGQRRSDGHDFFAKNGIEVALWNIDSQDWNQNINADQAGSRVLTLMLLWRRGVVLFHDITPKAQTAVPWLIEHTGKAGVSWVDCHRYPVRAKAVASSMSKDF